MSRLDGASVLVIGGAGLIGSHVVEELTKEDVDEIVVYDNFTRGTRENLADAMEDPRVRVFEEGDDILHTDLLREAVEGTDYVVHLAALWLMHCHEFPRSAFRVNVEGTFNVLEACRDTDVEKLVYSSSASVYGDAVEVPMTEDHPYNNRTFYGATKIAGEHMARAFHERYGLDYVALRYMNVYGPRQDYKGTYIAVMMKILDRIDAGKPPIIHGDGSQTYDFVYVRDVARANVQALKSDATDLFCNVGTGKGTTIAELTDLLLEVTGSDLEPEHREADREFVTNRIGSVEAAREELGFEAEVPLEEGLRRLVEWRNTRPDTATHEVR